MKKCLFLSVATFILLITLSQNSIASTVIGSFSDREWYQALYYDTAQSVTFEASYYLRSNIDEGAMILPPPDQWPGWESMIDLTLDSNVAGNTWTYQLGSPGYADNVDVLTNGLDDVFAFMTTGAYGYYSEDYFEYYYYAGSNGNDFAGFTIDTISFTLDQFKPIDDPGAIYYTVNIYGEQNASPVPIPGAVWLLGAGLVGLLGMRKKLKG